MAVEASKDLDTIIADLAERPDGEVVHKGPSRAAKREAWETAPFDDVVREQIADMVQQIGVVDLQSLHGTALESEHIEGLMGEVLSIDEISDALKGRRNAVRKVVFASLDLTEGEDEPGELGSEAHGKKFSRVIRGGKPFVNWSALEKVVEPEVWNQITNRVETTKTVFDGDKIIESSVHEERVPSETKVMAAIESGLLGLEDLRASMDYTKVSPSFNIFNL